MLMRAYIDNFTLNKGNFNVSVSNQLAILPELFNHKDRKLSFPPYGIIDDSEIEYYLDIKFENKLVGFYKITYLFFENTLELHGSFAKSDSFLVRGYYELTKLFVLRVSNDWPKFKIKSMANKRNLRVQNFLEYLNFKKEKTEGNYIVFRLNS